MACKTPRSVTLLIDSREKYPLLFPESVKWYEDHGVGDPKLIRVKTRIQELPFGDYCILGYESSACVERKGSLEELHQNLQTSDRARFIRAIEKMVKGCQSPYLLLDVAPLDLWKPTPRTQDPASVWDALCSVVVKYRLCVIWGASAKFPGPRRILGEQILRLLLSHSLRGDKWHEKESKETEPAKSGRSPMVPV